MRKEAEYHAFTSNTPPQAPQLSHQVFGIPLQAYDSNSTLEPFI